MNPIARQTPPIDLYTADDNIEIDTSRFCPDLLKAIRDQEKRAKDSGKSWVSLWSEGKERAFYREDSFSSKNPATPFSPQNAFKTQNAQDLQAQKIEKVVDQAFLPLEKTASLSLDLDSHSLYRSQYCPLRTAKKEKIDSAQNSLLSKSLENKSLESKSLERIRLEHKSCENKGKEIKGDKVSDEEYENLVFYVTILNIEEAACKAAAKGYQLLKTEPLPKKQVDQMFSEALDISSLGLNIQNCRPRLVIAATYGKKREKGEKPAEQEVNEEASQELPLA